MEKKYLTEWKKYLAESERLNEAEATWSIEETALKNMVNNMNAALENFNKQRIEKGQDAYWSEGSRFSLVEEPAKKTIGGAQYTVPVWKIKFAGKDFTPYGIDASNILANNGGNKSQPFRVTWQAPFVRSGQQISAAAQKMGIKASVLSLATRLVKNIGLEAYNNWLKQREGAGDVIMPK